MLLLAGGSIGLIMILGRSSYVTRANEFIEQPLQFSHARHVGDDGIDCRYCRRIAGLHTLDNPWQESYVASSCG